MVEHRWPGGPPPDDLGAVAHGPVLLARSPGVAVGLRCVFAYPAGLLLPVVLVASGPAAEVADRGAVPVPGRTSAFRLLVEANGKRGVIEHWRRESESGDGSYVMHADYWVDELPDDAAVTLTVAWPQVGLPETSTAIALDGLSELDGRVVSLH